MWIELEAGGYAFCDGVWFEEGGRARCRCGPYREVFLIGERAAELRRRIEVVALPMEVHRGKK